MSSQKWLDYERRMNERNIVLQKLSCKDNYFVQSIVLSNLYELRTECSKRNSRNARRTRSWATRRSTYFEHECIKKFYIQFKVFVLILKIITQREYVRHRNVLHLCVTARKRSTILIWLYLQNSSPKNFHSLRTANFEISKILVLDQSWHQAVKRNSATPLLELQFECRDIFKI